MLQRQTAADRLEIIVIDSGSPENEWSIIEEMQAVSDNIVALRTPRESLYAAWNRALAMATGTYFANVNVDDWLRDDALELFARALDRYPLADLAYAHWAATHEARQAPTEHDAVRFHPPYQPALPLFYCYSGSTQFWRTSSLAGLGGFDATFTACGDLEVLRRLTLAGGQAVLVPQVLEGFFQNPEGITQGSDAAQREERGIFARARAETPLQRLYEIDADDAESVAGGWTTLGNLAMQVRVPWHDKALNDVEFALHCYAQALAALPGYPMALHNVYAVLVLAARFDEADRSLASVAPDAAAQIRGAHLGLLHPNVEPACRGAVFSDREGVSPA